MAGSDAAVFTASMADDYAKLNYKDPDEAPMNTATGTSPSFLANRLSWYFDLKGPSVQLNTACSSSMIATDLACQCLRSGQCSMVWMTTGKNPVSWVAVLMRCKGLGSGIQHNPDAGRIVTSGESKSLIARWPEL